MFDDFDDMPIVDNHECDDIDDHNSDDLIAGDVQDDIDNPVIVDDTGSDDLITIDVQDDIDDPVVVDDIEHGKTQSMNGFCAPNAVAGIVETFVGHDVPEADVVGRAAAAGLLVPDDQDGWSGMDLNGVVELMGIYGIGSHVETGNVDTLKEHLEEGHKIILGIDSSEIWYGEDQSDTPDHAIWLVGIDDSDPDNPIAIINDSGDPENGVGRELPLSQLESAWEDSGYSMVVTDQAPDGSQFDILACGSLNGKSETMPGQPGDKLGGYYNADGTYHWESDNTDRDPETGKIVRRW